MSLSCNGPLVQPADAQVSERRKSLRWEVRVPVSLSGVHRSEGTMSNLSMDGCAIHTLSSYQRDEELLLVFVLPGRGQVIIRARVLWASWPFLGVAFCPGQDHAKLTACAYLDDLARRDLGRRIAIY